MGKNQHYIPQFYQKYWECERKGYLWEFDKYHKGNKDKGIRIQAIRSRNSQIYLYEGNIKKPDNIAESWYGQFETKYSDRYRKLIRNMDCLCRISDDEKRMLCRLVAHYSARNPRNVYENEWNKTIAAHFTLGDSDPDVDRRDILNLVAFTEGEMIEVFGNEDEKNNPDMMGDFAKELYSYNIRILISEESNIVFCDNITEQVTYPDVYYFPLCPTMLAVFAKGQSDEDKTVCKITPGEYSRFVQLYLDDQRVKRIYANNKEALQHLE